MKNNYMLKPLLCFYVFNAAIVVAGDLSVDGWPQYGHTANRISIAVDGPNTIDASTLQWTADQDPTSPEYYIEFEGPGNIAVFNSKVYAYAKVFDTDDIYIGSQIICLDSSTGQTLWHTVIDKAVSDSSSSPAVDTKHNTVIIGSGNKVFALDCASGNIMWSTPLEKSIVNASVCVAIDITPSRAFITDYNGTGSTGKLYCINLDPYNLNGNPYYPGEIVWDDILGGTSGATPAYKDGVVYVASVTDTSAVWPGGNGTLYAYDATAEPDAIRIWKTTDSRFHGFFGGVTVTKENYLYAASYNLYGKENNSELCKLDCDDGSIIWVTQTERTNSIPIVVDDMIYICGGIDGYYSRPKVSAYQDLGESVQKLWETPPALIIGGYTHQPVYADRRLYVGSIPAGTHPIGPYTDLYILDITKTPQDTGFIIDHYESCGSNPAVTHDSLYTVGFHGLHKFYQEAWVSNIAGTAAVDHMDLLAMADDWLWDGPVGVKRTDLNLDGFVNVLDFAILAGEWYKTHD